MVRARTLLEGTYAMIRIENIKRWSYIVQSVTILGVVCMLIVTGGSSLRPLYIPISSFLYFLLIMLLVLNIESFVFRTIEIKYNPSESRKFLMVKNSMHLSMTIIAVALLFTAILLVPAVPAAISRALSENIELSTSNNVARITSQDHFGFTEVTEIRVVSSSPMTVYILSAKSYQAYINGDPAAVENRFNIVTDPSEAPIVFTPLSKGFEEYYVVVAESIEPNAVARCHVSIQILPSLIVNVATILIGFITANAIWVGILTPLKKKYARMSIYL